MPPKLKINPPRRRESERVKTKRSASAASTPTTATSGTSAGDTIEVAQKSDAPITGNANVVTATEIVNEIATRNVPDDVLAETSEMREGATENATLRERADQETADVDGAITEYDFSNESDDYVEDDESEDPPIFTDITHEVITISSDDEGEGIAQEAFDLDLRPWKSMSSQQREVRENMYCDSRELPIQDWETTELYQERLDAEIEEYIKDFPLQEWQVGLAKAQRGFEGMLQRKRLRSMGVGVFQNQYLAAMGVQQMPTPPTMMPMDFPSPHSGQHSGQPTRGHHQMPMVQHHQPYPMPLPHMMHHGGMSYAMGPPPLPPQNGILSHHTRQQFGGPSNQATNLSMLSQPPPHPSVPSAIDVPSHSWVTGQLTRESGVGDPMQAYQSDLRGRKRQKRETWSAAAPTEPSIVPPYPVREKTIGEVKETAEPSVTNKRVTKRRVVEAMEFPWNRDINFEAAKAAATWEITIYNADTLTEMEAVRARNAKYVVRIDLEDLEKQHQSKLAKKQATAEDLSSQGKPKRQKKEPKSQDGGGRSSPAASDTPGCGQFRFATADDSSKAMKLVDGQTETSPEGIMALAGMGKIRDGLLDRVNICWNPAKKGLTQDLEQVTFSIRDSLITREHLRANPILTNAAARCIIDFCPDLLWRHTLLRITSETDLRNKDVRDRMCDNGNYIDKATITKRVGSALGQKQVTTTAAGSKKKKKKNGDDADKEAEELTKAELARSEENYYKQNCEDYQNYQLFFGKGASVRKTRTSQSKKGKRRVTDEAESSAVGSRPGSSGSNGSVMELKKTSRRGSGVQGVKKQTSLTLRNSMRRKIVQLDGAGDEREEEGVDQEEDAVGEAREEAEEVSEQSDGQLDQISD